MKTPNLIKGLALVLLAQPLVAGPAPVGTTLDIDDIRDAITLGLAKEDVVREIRAAEELELTREDLEALRRQGAPEEVLAALEERLAGTFLVEGILARHQAGATDLQIISWILAGGARPELTLAHVRRLREAGVAREVIRALAGDYVAPPGFRSYQDPFAMIAFLQPESWQSYEWSTGGGYTVLASPERGVREPNGFTVGFQVQVSYLAEHDPIRTSGVMAAHQRELPSLMQRNADFALEPIAPPCELVVDGHPAVSQDFDVTMRGTACRERMVRAVAGELDFFMEFIAPVEQFEELQGEMELLLATLRLDPGRPAVERRALALSPAEAMQRFQGSVVRVMAGPQGGTGFFVREDGWILTNAHVVTEEASGQPIEGIEVIVIDPASGRERTLEAVLVDFVHQRLPLVDLALLRVPAAREPYPALPLGSVASGVNRKGDPVIALGFPGIGAGHLYLTEGIITSFRYVDRSFAETERKVLNDVVTGVTIAPGNSGGPCINLATGSVIGLNTYVPLGGGGSDMLNYSGVCAIDKAVELFPQLRWYPHGTHMTAGQHLELANMLLTTGRVRGARMELERALEEEDALGLDQRASLYWLCALVRHREGDYDGFLSWRERSFELDPEFFPAASNVALSLAGESRIDQALEICDALVRAEPTSWNRRHVRADALRLAGLNSQALAELEQAVALAPPEQPDLVLMRGEILAASGDDEAARAIFERGAQAAPHHLGLRLALADHLAACGETSAAAIAYRALVNDFPTSRESLAAFGRFKRDHLLQAEDALNALCQAISNSMDAGQFAADLMVEASELATLTPGREQVGLILAMVLFEDYPGWRARAHELLGKSWGALGVESLAGVHAGCASAGTGGTLPARVPLLTPPDVVLMALSSYPSELVLDVLDVSSLGFVLDLRAVEQLVAQAPQVRDHIPLLLVSTMRDQMAGTGALGATVEVAFLDKVSVDVEGSHAPITFRNTSAVPLTSLIVRKAYYDEHSNELYASQGLLATRDPVLRPGAERSLDFRFNSWAELEAAGVPRERVASFSVSVVSARNASYLEQIRIVGGVSESGYRLSLVNQSLFTIKRVVLRCDYQLESGQPVVDARGLPVFSTSVIEDVTLPPSSQLDGVVIPEWTDPGHVHGLGAVLPSDADVLLEPAVVDVVLSIS